MATVEASSTGPSGGVDRMDHRSKLAQIMRYCADMQKLSDTSKASSFFVRECSENVLSRWRSHFFHEIDCTAEQKTKHGKVLLSSHETDIFSMKDSEGLRLPEPPSPNDGDGSACWLELRRLLDCEEKSKLLSDPDVVKYVEEFLKDNQDAQLENALEAAPENISQKELVKDYLTKQPVRKKYRIKYDQFFEWKDSGQRGGDLLWGFGHVRMVLDGKELVNGPWMEVPVEVVADIDGNISVKPRKGARVSLNREVSGVIQKYLKRSLKDLEDEVEAMNRKGLSIKPSESKTYKSHLKNMVTKLSANGTFQETTIGSRKMAFYTPNLLVTDAWCIYSRVKATSPSARDADTFANELDIGNLETPVAALALTHGTTALQGKTAELELKEPEKQVPYLPLPVSVDQRRLIELLLRDRAPGAVLQGPPGTGKTHTITNVTSAYLSLGMRVLIHSKSSEALSVISKRMPSLVQHLCVDLSASESALDTELPQSVERLYNQISQEASLREGTNLGISIENKLKELESEKTSIDDKISRSSKSRRRLLDLYNEQPFVGKIATWTFDELLELQAQLTNLIEQQPKKEARNVVIGHKCSIPDELISVAESKMESPRSIFNVGGRLMTFLGSFFDSLPAKTLQKQLAAITVDGKAPESKEDWQDIVQSLRFEKAMEEFDKRSSRYGNSWPKIHATSLQPCKEALDEVIKLRQEVGSQVESRDLDVRRREIVTKIQQLAEELVNTKAVVKLAEHSSGKDLGKMLKFYQIAGKSKFTPATKMSDRQNRNVEEARDALRGCSKIPCWIMTTNQISEYLPPDAFFDLVILDEASQSDIRALPAMLRGKQWLIVGDSKQVSPTEDFKSEKDIQQLTSMLPRVPFSHSIRPGNSFFDLCEQVFAKGCRVSLKEHFRCAPELIAFSNNLCYDNRLIPLRLPTSLERITPCLVDIRVPSVKKAVTTSVKARGKKGKQDKTATKASQNKDKGNQSKAEAKAVQIHEAGCDKIVEIIREIVRNTGCDRAPRTIGVVMLLGKDQVPEILKRLKDETTGIGIANLTRHDILIGDAAMFQGVEKDIIVVGILCIGRPPSQNQLRDVQRANVALSRARDQMLLVRSIDATDVASTDVKSKVIEFFAVDRFNQRAAIPWEAGRLNLLPELCKTVARQLKGDLVRRGFVVTPIGAMWKQASCVELPGSDARAALCIEIAGESENDWNEMLAQQRGLERVGWHCFRVDAFSLSINAEDGLETVMKFLEGAGLTPPPPVPLVEIVNTSDNRFQTDEEKEDVIMKDDSSKNEVRDDEATNRRAQPRRPVSASSISNNPGSFSTANSSSEMQIDDEMTNGHTKSPDSPSGWGEGGAQGKKRAGASDHAGYRPKIPRIGTGVKQNKKAAQACKGGLLFL